MKKIIFPLLIMVIMGNICSAQYTNWNSDNSDKRNAVSLQLGYDYALTLGAGYTRTLDFFKPMLLGIEYSIPMGDNLFDDHKIKIGGEIELLNKKNLYVSAKAKGIIRRYQSDNVNILNFGSDLGLTAGIYKTKWYLAGELGFDKAISSHLKHTELFKEIYPQVEDGWFLSTGGQFYYDLNAGYSIHNLVDLNLKVGMTNAQWHDTNALLPYYVQIGINRAF